uniref:Cytochrome P450 n=1 Tax=Steinernema glaseri TaxID=37863 RepID=A0A1I7YPM7_9BILA
MIGAILSAIGNLWLPLAIALLFFYVLYLKKRAQYFKKRGIPSPTAQSLFLGHLKEKERDGQWFVRYRDWEDKYGRTFGIYEGGHRLIVTSDLDILDDVFNKQFSKFHARKVTPDFAADQATMPGAHLFMSEGARWKRLRALVAEVFTTGKVRSAEAVANDTIRAVMRQIEKDMEKSDIVDLKPHFLSMSLDLIERLSLGRPRTRIGTETTDHFGETLLALFADKGVSTSWIRSFFAGIYEFRRVSSFLFRLYSMSSLHRFVTMQKKLREIYARKSQDKGDRPKDFVNHLMEARIDKSDIEDYGKTVNDRRVQKKLTAEEIMSTMAMFLVAGYDTTANTVTYLCYRLAQNEDVQEKLYEEEDITMSTVQSMQYLDWCVKECLRMDPHATGALERRCTETTTVGKANKLEIEKGVCVGANTYSIHFNEQLWPEPYKFRPERFSPEESAKRHPLAWQPFGMGPRICVGMRLALLEVKLAIVHTLKEFSLHVCDETNFKCSGNITVSPETMKLRVEKR